MDHPPGRLLIPLLALVVGLWAGWVDLHEPGFRGAVCMIAMAGFAAGFAMPWRALPASVLMGFGVPLMHVAALILRLPTTESPTPLAALFALVPALISALAGMGVRQSVIGRLERA